MNPEPKNSAGEKPAGLRLPGWLLALFCTALFGALIRLDHQAGDFNPQVYAPYNNIQQVADAQPPKTADPQVEKGAHIFANACAACHQAGGQGSPGQFPPLAGAEWVLEKDPARLIRIVQLGLTGPLTIKGQEWNTGGVMPSMAAAAAADEDLAAVLTYIRQAWGNQAAPVTGGQVKKVRGEISGRTEAVTAKELLALPVSP